MKPSVWIPPPSARARSVPVVPGRMRRVDLGQPFEVIVDYAHTPAALQTVLDLLAPVAAARWRGCLRLRIGRQAGRGQAADRWAGSPANCRVIVLTDEDPRTGARR